MRLRQPDRRSCGAASLVMARRLARPDYAEQVGDQATFAREVARLHRRLTSPLGTTGGLQLPWPPALGTPPWAAARELRRLTGTHYAVHLTRRPGQSWSWLREATPSLPVVAYVGDRWLPRHVVLVVEHLDDGVWTYEPAAGLATLVSRTRWVDGPLRLAGWDQPWLVCAPGRPGRAGQ